MPKPLLRASPDHGTSQDRQGYAEGTSSYLFRWLNTVKVDFSLAPRV